MECFDCGSICRNIDEYVSFEEKNEIHLHEYVESLKIRVV